MARREEEAAQKAIALQQKKEEAYNKVWQQAEAAAKAQAQREADAANKQAVQELIHMYTQLEQIKQQEAQLSASSKATTGQAHTEE